MEILVVILIVVLAAVWIALSRRLREVERRLEQESRGRQDLVARVYNLEKGAAPVKEPQRAAAPEAVAPRVKLCQFCGRTIAEDAAICACGAVIDARRLPPPLPAPPPVEVPAVEPEPVIMPRSGPEERGSMQETAGVGLRERLREKFGDREWEAIVGGSWFNKLGVLVLVIAIASLLQYEFGRVGPAGRIAIGYGISIAMLGAGVWIERRAGFEIFARGLIGGGWAALYFTTYAMHGLEAARVIDNPIVASVLLLAVAAGMIAHSLRYRSQTVSGLAYFIAFATLALSENTGFSVVALIPLAASLLALAYRFEWFRMAVFGLIATYASCASRPDAGAPLASTQALFGVYWLLFEVFDLMRVRKRTPGFSIESLIFPLNAFAFLAMSWVKWYRSAPEQIFYFFAAGAVLYLASALLRAHLAPPDPEQRTIDRMAAGGYEGPITISAALAAFAIFRRAHGIWINLGWLVEGELLVIAGVRLAQPYLRHLAGAIFAASLGKLLGSDLTGDEKRHFGGRDWLTWTPVAIANACLFYANRAMRIAEGSIYSWAASALVTIAVGFETPSQYAGIGWLVFGVILFEFGFRKRNEFRFQAYAVGALAILNLAILNVLQLQKSAAPAQRISLSIATVICCAISARVFRSQGDEFEWVRDITAAAGTMFAMALAWLLLLAPLVALAWAVIGLVLIELGFNFALVRFRAIGNAAGVAVIARLFLANFTDLGNTLHLSHRMLTVVPILLSQYYVWWRYRGAETRVWERSWVRMYLYAPAILALVLMRFELGRSLAVAGWALLGLALYRFGLQLAIPDLRSQSYAIALLAFWRCWNTNFYIPESLLGIQGRVLTGAFVIASFYAAQLLAPRSAAEGALGRVDRHARTFYSLLASVLLAVLLFYQVSGGMLTVAWGIEGLALLGAGFPLRDRVQRLSGLLLFLICVLKLFLYDLRELETINRIISFIVLGVILVSVSWVYTRFRDRIQRYL